VRPVRVAVPVGLVFLAATPLVLAMRNVANEEWISYGCYMAAGLGLAGAALAWYLRILVGVRWGLTVSAAGLLVRFVLAVGISWNPYLLTAGVWALGSLIGALWSWWNVRGGMAAVVGVSAAAFTGYLALHVREPLLPVEQVAALVVGIAGALAVAWGLTARDRPDAAL
jgi:hypothetical protein